VMRGVAKEYGWNYKFGGPLSPLLLIAKLRGVQAALDYFTQLKKTGVSEDVMGERSLNELGYRLLYGGRQQDGVTVFRQNVKLYPQSSNVYDSLGEAYANTGEKELAIENYEKSLQLNPKNDNAKERLKKLRDAK
jgi:tetratricopeptide (TPR) repeat protein